MRVRLADITAAIAEAQREESEARASAAGDEAALTDLESQLEAVRV